LIFELDNTAYMLYTLIIKVKELIERLEAMGWQLKRITGSHHVFTRPGALRSITVPVHGKDIHDHFAKAIIKQANEAMGIK
jgi:predicted RNA binding protein YcfA (HicA-like mRNA interferase family)